MSPVASVLLFTLQYACPKIQYTDPDWYWKKLYFKSTLHIFIITVISIIFNAFWNPIYRQIIICNNKKKYFEFLCRSRKASGTYIYVPESIYNVMQLLYCTQFKSLLKLQFSNPQRNCRSGTIKKKCCSKVLQ